MSDAAAMLSDPPASDALPASAVDGAARLRDVYQAVRADTDALSAPLSAEDHLLQSMPDASPVKWHLAHTTWFWECFVLKPHVPRYTVFDADYTYLFNSYYDHVGARHPRPQRGLLSRPALEEVRAYRAHVDQAMAALLDEAAPAALEGLVRLGLAHEQQHQELILTDLKHALAQHPCAPVAYRADGAVRSADPGPMAWRTFAGGLGWYGAADEDWAFDNERPRHQAFLAPFEVADRPVTQGEVETFIIDGGYETATLWLSDGWAWAQERRIVAPAYWRGGPGEWRSFTLHGEEELDAHAPAAHLSYFEADAIARWMGARLPDEREWEHAAIAAGASQTGVHAGRFARPGYGAHPRFESAASGGVSSPQTAGETGPGDLRQMFGGVWEWTRSAYDAYPRYAPGAGALGEYNGKFMCGQYVLRGGSCATPRGHVRASYRNFFHPGAQWQFTGVRLARDVG